MRLAKLHQVAVRAPDLDAAIAFYRDVLGAAFVARFDPPGLAFFNFDGVRLLLDRNATAGTLYFHVEDIDAAVAELLERGLSIESGPVMIHRDEDGTFGPAGEEEWMAFFKDPGGNTLALATRRTARD